MGVIAPVVLAGKGGFDSRYVHDQGELNVSRLSISSHIN